MPRERQSIQALFAELKRRQVFRVIAVYGGVAFVVLQVADLAFPLLGLPEWTLTFILLLTMLGFPLAVVLAWLFDKTADGVMRTEPASDEELDEIVEDLRAHHWASGLLALGAMILLFATGWWMGSRDAAPRTVEGGVRAIAVLPLENVNASEENRIFAAGFHDDLVNRLSRIGALRVTSRTSVREYAGTLKRLTDIATELGVGYVLEGSVRSAGDNVRVSLTLVDAARDTPLWSDQFDRNVTPDNLLDIQAEVALRVVHELRAHLSDEDLAGLEALELSSDIVAQTWYYRGVDKFSGSLTDLEEARDNLVRSVEIDPGFVAAWSFLSLVESRRYSIGEDSGDAAREAMERTIQLAPGSAEAHLAVGFFRYFVESDFPAALSAFRAAERRAPSSADAVWAQGAILRRQGDWDASTESFWRAIRLDPRNSLRIEGLAENLTYMGAFAAADSVVESWLAIDPSDSGARAAKVGLLVARDGDTRRARRSALELDLDPRKPQEFGSLLMLARLDRDYREMLALANQLEPRGVAYVERGELTFRASALHLLGSDAVGPVADSILEAFSGVSTRRAAPQSYRALAHYFAGRYEDALREARTAERILREWEDHVLNPRWGLLLVEIYGGIGEIEAGLGLLTDLVNRPADRLNSTILRLSSAFDVYRADARFDELILFREQFEAGGELRADAAMR